MASPTEGWLSPTDGSTNPTWEFGCRVSGPYGQFEPMRVRYVDYSGERLTKPQLGSAEQEELEYTFRNADALLGLLDGRKVLAMMRGDRQELD
ncbi:hypothetical protein [Streptomyces sp. KL116D]|uniref:hypothetical protein n=1 Tax=Streptomyces sp. KL116D TaxID=3045152 RepID=UPI003555F755